jgi:hypothetical protein
MEREKKGGEEEGKGGKSRRQMESQIGTFR